MDLVNDKEHLHELWNQANSLCLDGDWSAAIALYSQIIEAAPDCVPALVERGLLDLQMGHAESARQDFARALELDVSFGPAYYGRGWLRHVDGDFEGELQDAEHGLQLDPEHAGLYYRRLGSAYQGLGECKKAIQAYSQAIHERYGEDHATLYSRGKCYLEMGKYEAALADFDRSLEIDPNRGWAYAARAFTYFELGQHDRAIADCDQAIQLQPEYIPSFLTRGLACQALGRTHNAIENFRYVLTSTPNPIQREVAAQHLRQLQSLASH
jgi:tetratricopeptide (TPR) repeat protein